MNVVSPKTNPKLRITMPSQLSIKAIETPIMYTKKPFDEYTLFLILEEQRNLKLKEVYHKRGLNLVHDEDEDQRSVDVDLPNYPPRYHNLNYTAQWYISKLNGPRRPIPTKASAQSWKNLDQMSLSFLRAMAAILRDRYNENYQVDCHTPAATHALNNRSMTITPVISPPKRQLDGLEALLLSSKVAFPSLPSLADTEESRQPSVCRNVDMKDDEIRAMWMQYD